MRARASISESNSARAAPQPLHPDPAGGSSPARVEALYVHIPFCFHKCHYCDFYSLAEPDGDDRQEAFTDRLIAELMLRAQQCDLRPATLFIGGGTPTLLRQPLWERWLTALADSGVLRRIDEFTVEANPETVTPSLARLLVAGGVDRISIGAQSFSPPLLKALERWHEPDSVARAVNTLRSAGVRRINLDLLFAIPGQTLSDLDADLDAALALHPDHVSCYGLTYEPGTALTTRLRLGRVQRVGEDDEAVMYRRVMDRLADAGFVHYEVSNWARGPHAVCRHNLAYWHNRDWLGLGPSAASHLLGWRWKNVPRLGDYLSTADHHDVRRPDARADDPRPGSYGEPPIADLEHLDEDARVGEAIMLRMRLREGVPLDWLRANVPPDSARVRIIDELTGLGLLERPAFHLRLTPRGLMVADSVIARLL